MEISVIFDSKRQVRIIRQVLFILTLAIAFYSYSAYATRVSDKIYSPLQSDHYCSRRLNATSQMGCSSELGGNLGVIWVVEHQSDLDHILKTGPTPPYIVVLKHEHYTRENLLSFKANLNRVAGVVLIDFYTPRTKPFSPDDQCPNRYAGLYVNDSTYGDCKKNLWQQESPISGLLQEDIPYPIFLMNEQKSVDEIQSCFSNNNIIKGSGRLQDTYPLCSMQLDSFMLAASDTKTCLNSHSLVDEILQSNGQRCYTVENQNLFGYYKPTYGPLRPVEGSNLMAYDTVESQSVVLIIAKLSSLSMFTEISPGADSTIMGIVTQLAIAEALGRIRNDTEVIKSNRNIAFAFLDSEPFDYTGSSRMSYNMQNNSFPNRPWLRLKEVQNAMKNINLTALDYIINLDQLANYPNSDTIYIHSHPEDKENVKLVQIKKILDRTSKTEKINFASADANQPLPPTPVHQFVKHSRSLAVDNRPLGIVLSNYGKTYTNLFFNSIYDDNLNVLQTSKAKLVEHISRIAGFVAKGAFELAFKVDRYNDILIDKGLIEDLLECYMVDANCNLFTRAWQAGQQLPSGPIQTYKDPTKRSDDMNGAITANLLAYFLGDKIAEYNLTRCMEENEKSLIYNYQYVNGKNEPIKDETSGVCIRSQALKVPSTSPAFEVTSDGIIVKDDYPAWTVSLNGIRNPVRIFLKPSPISQWCILLLGIVITCIAFVVVHQIKVTISKLQVDSEIQPGTST